MSDILRILEPTSNLLGRLVASTDAKITFRWASADYAECT